jgi:hypothetical protein
LGHFFDLSGHWVSADNIAKAAGLLSLRRRYLVLASRVQAATLHVCIDPIHLRLMVCSTDTSVRVWNARANQPVLYSTPNCSAKPTPCHNEDRLERTGFPAKCNHSDSARPLSGKFPGRGIEEVPKRRSDRSILKFSAAKHGGTAAERGVNDQAGNEAVAIDNRACRGCNRSG